MQNQKSFFIIIAVIALAAILYATSALAAGPPMQEYANTTDAITTSGIVANKISYQGRLTDLDGKPIDGAVNLVFQFWDQATAGNQIGDDYIKNGVTVDNGLVTVELEVSQDVFDGSALWLRVQVNGEWLNPRQELLPAPYALGLAPNARVRARDIGIGTTNPKSELHAVGDLVLGLDANNKKFVFHSRTNGDGDFLQITHDNSDGNWDWQQGITLRRGGDVGIGTTGPQAKLDVVGTTRTQVLQITGGADLSEQFEIREGTTKLQPASGMVVSIDPDNPGELLVSTKAYDKRVAGIISGAGGIKPGMLMGQSGSEADGEYPVALTGRVYVKADASSGPIEPGDRMTTSDIPGHAMKVIDHEQAQGAILGKAMTGLDEGHGLVLVLVSLQ